jgi:hypothetical protein
VLPQLSFECFEPIDDSYFPTAFTYPWEVLSPTPTQFLASNENQRTMISKPYSIDNLTEDDTISMARFHLTIVEPLVSRYIEYALIQCAVEVTPDREPIDAIEKIRIFRGMYRLQLGCQLFGSKNFKVRENSTHEFDHIDILEHFLCKFEPWEIEEIVCIYVFAKDAYDWVSDKIHRLLHSKTSFLGRRRPQSVFHHGAEWNRQGEYNPNLIVIS